jgi:hypothetical protein
MRSRRAVLLPRGRLPSDRQSTPKPFKHISIERPVIWESSEEQKKYWKFINRALGNSIRHPYRQSYHPIRPENMTIVQYRSQSLAEGFNEVSSREDLTKRMLEILKILEEHAVELLEEYPDQMKLKLGDLACQPSQLSFSAQIEGWRGHRSNYPEFEDGYTFGARRQLAKEHVAYLGMTRDMADAMDQVGVNDALTPAVDIVHKNVPIDLCERRAFEGVIREAVEARQWPPSPLTFGDPTFNLVNRGGVNVIHLPLRPQSIQEAISTAA